MPACARVLRSKYKPNRPDVDRDDFLRSKVPLRGRIVVHGHSICDLPQNREHRINIDTGAFVSGRLTSLVLRGGERRFLSTSDDAQD